MTGFPAALRLEPLDRTRAAELTTWHYPPPYDLYDLTDVDPDELADPAAGFHALLAGREPVGGELVGFRSYGADGRVPGFDYEAHDAGLPHGPALDTGGGLRPDLTGRGLGREAIAAGLAHGRALFAPDAFRVTVAAFNRRALRVLGSLGFEEQGAFAAANEREFVVLLRSEAPGGR